jgi:RNA polymerase sigma-70 factor, ECF subfamily
MPLAESERLLSKLRQGTSEAFEDLFHAYYSRVFGVAYRLVGSEAEAEDIAQEAFLRLYLQPLPAGREHNVLGWLLRVATNLAYNALRSRHRRTTRERRAAGGTVGESLGTQIEASVTADTVRQVLAELPERHVRILMLRHAGLSYIEIAEALGVSPGSVGTLLARAERAFRARYTDLGG